MKSVVYQLIDFMHTNVLGCPDASPAGKWSRPCFLCHTWNIDVIRTIGEKQPNVLWIQTPNKSTFKNPDRRSADTLLSKDVFSLASLPSADLLLQILLHIDLLLQLQSSRTWGWWHRMNKTQFGFESKRTRFSAILHDLYGCYFPWFHLSTLYQSPTPILRMELSTKRVSLSLIYHDSFMVFFSFC